jgi:hypothetical protein
MINYKIFTEIDDIKSNYETASIEKVSGLKRSQSKVIKMVEYYSDSKYLGANLGNVRKVGDGQIDVPFYNIVNYRVDLAKTATDLDIKDIQIKADNPKYQVHSMLLNREAYEWMKKTGFAKTLNDMGLTRPKYGGYLLKKSTIDGELKIDVVRWTNVITDQSNILGGPVIETHHMTPVELKNKDGIWDNVRDVLKAHKKMKAEDRPTTIDIHEITGEFPIAFRKEVNGESITDEDEYLYKLQRYFIADINEKKYLLYSEELSGKMGDYYEYLSWNENGYGLGRGVIEDSEEAQVWTNDAVINESIAMSLAGRAGIITDSKKIGNNILEHDHGKVYKVDKGEMATSFNLMPAALGQYQNQIEKWKAQADNVTSSYNAATGEQPPSGTPYSQTALLNQVATKPFDYKREEWGIHLTKVFEEWVIPYLIKKIKKEHILVSEFSDEELDVIDESFATYSTNEDIKQQFLKGNVVYPEQQMQMMDEYKKLLGKTGKRRFIKIPSDYFKDIECKVTVVTTGEQKDKAVMLQSIDSLIAKYIQSFNPNTGQYGVATDPFLSKMFKEAIELVGSGISPVSLGKGAKPVNQNPMEPVSTPTPEPSTLTQPA